MRRRQCGGAEAEARTGEGKAEAARRPVGEAEVVRRKWLGGGSEAEGSETEAVRQRRRGGGEVEAVGLSRRV